MPDPKEIEASKQLVVEGKDCLLFFDALRRKLDLGDVQVQNFGGTSELRWFLDALRLISGFGETVESVGIIRDADNDADGAFKSVCGSIDKVGWSVPENPETPTGSDPRVNVLILPGNANPGMLEDLLLDTVAADPAVKCVDDFFNCLTAQSMALPKNMSKARVHAFLASREKPNLRIGEAASKGYWPWTSGALDGAKSFLQSL